MEVSSVGYGVSLAFWCEAAEGAATVARWHSFFPPFRLLVRYSGHVPCSLPPLPLISILCSLAPCPPACPHAICPLALSTEGWHRPSDRGRGAARSSLPPPSLASYVTSINLGSPFSEKKSALCDALERPCCVRAVVRTRALCFCSTREIFELFYKVDL